MRINLWGAVIVTALASLLPAASLGGEAASQPWWSFQPMVARPVPKVKHTDWVTNPIDAFVLQKLESHGLVPSPLADKRTLIRRAYFDLIGLPPTPQEVRKFVADDSANAFEKVIDDLLSRPQYGERWARYWLDVVRYAQTSGYERDGEKPFAWRYRDYVIRSLNNDTPYDQFVRQQLAGDEIDGRDDDSIIATGFYRLGVIDDEPDDRLQAEYDNLDDNVRTIGAAFIGLTVGCARCHDHKFDPIPQKDYYALLSFLGNIRPVDQGPPNATSAGYTKLSDGGWALSVHERSHSRRKTTVMVRGNAHSPGGAVSPAYLSAIGGGEPPADLPSVDPNSTGLRRALAEWITRPGNPLTARVMVNRIWQNHFGRGIVRTPDDFGKTGTPPTHPELLDWLAERFVQDGWSIKKMHRLIMLSSTYRMSSQSSGATAEQLDAANDLFWRQNMRRLSAEALRDSALAVSGELNAEAGGRGYFPRLSREAIASGSRPGAGWELSSPEQTHRRSIYAFVKRSMLPPLLETFDFNNVTLPAGCRSETTVAPQALMLLNDDELQARSDAFADRIARDTGDEPAGQVTDAFQLALGRNPSAEETKLMLEFLGRQRSAFEPLRSQITFRLQVPSALQEGYLRQLKPLDFLSGPSAGWTYAKGRWTGAYEGIVSADALLGPFALCDAGQYTDGTIEARLKLHKASERGVLIVRGVLNDDLYHGYALVFQPRAQTISLERHDGKDVRVLASARAEFACDQWISNRIEVTGAHVRVWLNGDSNPVLDVTDPDPIDGPGNVGVSTWGAALTLDSLKLTTGGQTRVLSNAPDPRWAERSARAAMCLMILNLNEFVYVD